MKNVIYLSLVAVFLFAGNAIAADMNGVWVAQNLCISGDVLPDNPEPKESRMEIIQDGIFFITIGIYPQVGEKCGGVIIGKVIAMTCPPNQDTGTGTIFNGELKTPNLIEGINHVPDDGKTCSVIAVKQ